MNEEVAVRLTASVDKSSIIRGQRSRPVYTAKLGVAEASAGSKAEAGKSLAEVVRVALSNLGAPVVLWSLDGREAWIAFPDHLGRWGYGITELSRCGCDPRFGGSRLSHSSGAYGSRDECLERMRSHWYDCNVRCVVEGILALCTDLRRFECKKCRSVSVSGAPYACRNPACGEVFE